MKSATKYLWMWLLPPLCIVFLFIFLFSLSFSLSFFSLFSFSLYKTWKQIEREQKKTRIMSRKYNFRLQSGRSVALCIINLIHSNTGVRISSILIVNCHHYIWNQTQRFNSWLDCRAARKKIEYRKPEKEGHILFFSGALGRHYFKKSCIIFIPGK